MWFMVVNVLLGSVIRPLVFFFFQAEDGIRDLYVTGVQTCALPIFAGANTVTVTMNGAADTLRWAEHEFSGLSTTAPLDKTGSSSGTSTSPTSGSVTTTAASELVFGFSEAGDEPAWTAGSGYTLLEHPANKIGTEYKIVTSTLTTSAGFSINPVNDWAGLIATFK